MLLLHSSHVHWCFDPTRTSFYAAHPFRPSSLGYRKKKGRHRVIPWEYQAPLAWTIGSLRTFSHSPCQGRTGIMVLSSNPYSATSPGVTQLLILSAPWLSYLSTGSRLSRVAVMGTQPAITQCSTTALEAWAAEGACVGRRCTLLGVCHTPAQSHVSEYGLNASFSQLYSVSCGCG